MLMNELFALTPEGGTCAKKAIDEALVNVVMSQEMAYMEQMAQLPPRQKTILQAIAREGVARNITSSKFIKKYNLSSASSVQAAVKLLLKNDVLTNTDGAYRIYDYFFSYWLAKVY